MRDKCITLFCVASYLRAMLQKATLVIGASEKPDRYSNRAIQLLRKYGHPVWAIGARTGRVLDVSFSQALPETDQIDTVTL